MLAASFSFAFPQVLRPADGDLINDVTHIAYLNSHNASWVAGKNARFEGLKYSDVRPLLGTDLVGIEGLETFEGAVAGISDADVPDTFDSRTQWAGLIHPIRDQERCGSCWAFSATEVLSDRASIAAKKLTPVLSPEDLISCDTSDMGCQGGRLPTAWSYLTKTGAVSDKCFPYGAGSGTAPACANKCADSESWSSSKVKAKSAYAIKGVSNMQKEIMTNGPIQVAFKVYKSFMSYKTGVYSKHWYELIPEGGHAVKIIGWGTESGTDYWLVANSWNTNWGDEGTFKIKRGVDECGMETMGPPYAGLVA